jgi:hypothetical protein
MTGQQKEALHDIPAQYIPNEFHHSDHVGADSDGHAIAREACPTSRVVVHPPRDVSRRGHLEADAQRPARGRIARNREIVGESDMLIAAPGPNEDEQASEIWSMIRFAWRHSVTVVVLNPEADGAKFEIVD